MAAQKILIIIPLIAFSTFGFAQKKSQRSATYRVPVVSENKARIVCPIFNVNQYPYQGIGLKFGDPTAITYKLYPSRHWAFAVDVGKSSAGLYNDYFKHVGQNDTLTYISHKVTGDLFLETKLLYQWDAEKISKGLQVYTGLGWQWRNTNLNYNFSKKTSSGTKYETLPISKFTYGPVVIVGFEYAYFTWPISAFIEVELFTDNMADPGYHRFQGGVGLRYVF